MASAVARRTAKSGSGPFFGSNASFFEESLVRKHGPDPFALDFAVLLTRLRHGLTESFWDLKEILAAAP
jgi:hypothetical protein